MHTRKGLTFLELLFALGLLGFIAAWGLTFVLPLLERCVRLQETATLERELDWAVAHLQRDLERAFDVQLYPGGDWTEKSPPAAPVVWMRLVVPQEEPSASHWVYYCCAATPQGRFSPLAEPVRGVGLHRQVMPQGQVLKAAALSERTLLMPRLTHLNAQQKGNLLRLSIQCGPVRRNTYVGLNRATEVILLEKEKPF